MPVRNEVVTIKHIEKKGARCVTTYGSEIFVSWGNSLPVEIPKVGESWSVQKIDYNVWRFMERLRSGSYNVMRYAITLDARECVGRERGIVDDIMGIGVDEVYLKVASDGIVMWKSDEAASFGLECFGDHVTQIVDRLRYYGIAVTFVIDSELWANVSVESDHRRYQQVVYEDGGQSTRYSPKMSFLAAAEPMRVLVEELYNRYGSYARGVCFDNFSLDGEHADFSMSNRSAYVRKFGEEPTYELTENDGSSGWWDRHFQWTEFLSDCQREFVSTVKRNIGAWPVSAITSSRCFCPVEDGVKVGRLSTGIDDDFSEYGWECVGFPLAYTRQSDKAAELRSLEYVIACEQRMARRCLPLYVLDLSHMSQYDGVFEMLAKYDASTVLIDGYEDWRMLSDQQVIDIESAMDGYRVSERSTLDSVGISLSSNSRDIGCYDYETNLEFTKSMESLCSSLLDKLPHKLRIYFDEDLERRERVTETSALVLYMASNMSDSAIAAVESMLGEDGRGVCIVGRAGYMQPRSDEQRSYPFLKSFGQADFMVQEYVTELTVESGEVDISDWKFALSSTNVGITPVLEPGKGSSFVQVVHDGILVDKKVRAPVLFKNRSCMLAIDVIRDGILLDIASEMALFSVGRDS